MERRENRYGSKRFWSLFTVSPTKNKEPDVTGTKLRVMRFRTFFGSEENAAQACPEGAVVPIEKQNRNM
jgi:hypothetical protein